MTTEEHLALHDREIAAIRKLIIQGMKMLVEYQRENREYQKENREANRATRAAQRETDKQLKALIQSLRGGSNGRSQG